MVEKIPMTAAGHLVLETDLKHRQQVERPRIIQQITEARTHGDLSENAEYHAAKEQQSLNEGAITIPGYKVDSWWTVGIFTSSGFLDPDKPIGKYTKKEMHDFLYREPV